MVNLYSLIDFLFPIYCLACDKEVLSKEVFCLKCKLNLPLINENLASQVVKHRLNNTTQWSNIYTLYFMYKDNIINKSIHQLKYKYNIKPTNILLDYWLQSFVIDWGKFDYLIPIPIHKNKHMKRGYNQAEIIANRIARHSNVNIDNSILNKFPDSVSITHKNRYERLLSANSFYLSNEHKIFEKSILLIDDVFTTGSTLEKATQLLLDKGAKEVSVLTLAITMD